MSETHDDANMHGQPVLTLLDLLDGPPDDKTAIAVPDGRELTFAQLRREVRRTADALAEYGIERGDRVSIVLPNGAEVITAFLGTATVATAAPLNPNYTEDEYRFYLDDTGAKAVILPPTGADAARRAAGDRIIIEAALDANGVMQFSSSTPRQAGRTASMPTGDDVALVLHTSGTTSRPKRVPLKHRNITASVAHITATYQLTSDDVSLCLMPLFHVHGLVASTLSTLRTGGTVVVPPRFNPLGFWSLLAERGITWYSAVPTIHHLVLARAGRRTATSNNLRFVRSCSSALPPATLADLEALLDVPVLEAYGMTEGSHQIASNPLPPEAHKPGTVGKGTGVRVAIMDDDGRLLPAGDKGEVVIQGPNVTDGYENNPEANAASFTDGWFRTGDLGALDDDGYLTLLSRLKELINRGGEKIAPREIDELLLQHPAVGEAVAFGLPHPVWGEEVAVAVVLPGEASEAELLRHCREHLADFKVPKKLFVVESIPRTATGKVQRRHVAAEIGGQA
jgi:acyl-CoA synthetase (AMP-forming)/AMP-acid ligase II